MGSATVAMAVASGILAPMAGTMGVRPEMLVLATGSGSLMLSHVNDSGFWLVGSLFKIDEDNVGHLVGRRNSVTGGPADDAGHWRRQPGGDCGRNQRPRTAENEKRREVKTAPASTAIHSGRNSGPSAYASTSAIRCFTFTAVSLCLKHLLEESPDPAEKSRLLCIAGFCTG